MSTKTLKIEFNQTGDFSAYTAAKAWCDERGISYGSTQRDAPVGLMYGDYEISKWRNMTAAEIAQLDGRITGDKRNGPVTITICEMVVIE